MNIRNLTLGALLAAAFPATAADIFPQPQQIAENGTAFARAGATFSLVGAEGADADAVRLLSLAGLPSGSAVEIVVGEAGDDAVSAYESKIPAREQGYYLSVAADRVVVAGRDGEGTFYGVQSLLQLLDNDQVPAVEITDWPDTPVRGIVEGYYGNPWSKEDRLDMMRNFMPHSRMNVYIYGPKDDPYHHGGQVFEEYPADKGAELSELAVEGLKNKVHMVWAMHPGNSIEGDNRTAAVAKFEKMYDLGFRQFAVFFDDIQNYDVNKQIEFLNYINAEIVKKHSDVAALIVCPSQYNQGWSGNGDYHKAFGEKLDRDIEVMWTGRGVVDIRLGDASRWFTEKSNGFKPLIWENYPVNDYGYTVRPLLMSPFPAPDADLSSLVCGYTSNPMEYYYASKVALYGAADFNWNAAKYNDWECWDKTLGFLLPDHKDALKTFCYSSFYYPGNTHGLVVPYQETPEFKELREANPTFAADTYRAYFAGQVAAGTELLGVDSPLTAEIAEFLLYFKLQGERGNLVCDMRAALDARNGDGFIAVYSRYSQLTDSAAAIISRDFPGTIKRFQANCGNLLVEPFIKQTANDLASEFKSAGYEYPDGLFPEQVIPDGNYLIKYNGLWLSNGSGAAANTPAYPSFSSTEDDVNSTRQAWSIRYDMNTGRYAIRSVHDNRYVNEKGEFTVNEETNPFESAWHTYEIISFNGKFAIRNGGSAGTDFWKVSTRRIQKDSSSYSPDVFRFELIPAEGGAVRDTVAMLNTGVSYFIVDDQNRILRRSSNDLKFIERPSRITNNHKFKFVLNDNGRYELRSAAVGSPYVNEKGVIGTNAFSADWNTYEVYERNGRFAIRNCVTVNNNENYNYWIVSGDRIGFADIANVEAYQFRLEDPDQTSISEVGDGLTGGDGILYDLQGRRAPARPAHGIYILNGHKIRL